jgi:hypothetical protein
VDKSVGIRPHSRLKAADSLAPAMFAQYLVNNYDIENTGFTVGGLSRY